SRRAVSSTVSPSSTLPPGTAHRPRPGSRPRLTRRTRRFSTTATPTPGSGRSEPAGVTTGPVGGIVVAMHDDRAGRKAASLEEVLGEAVPGQDMSVEACDPEFAEGIHRPISHRLGHTDLTRLG